MDFVGKALSWARGRMPNSDIEEIVFGAHKLGSTPVTEAVRFDVSSTKLLGRASVWDTGLCDLEAIYIVSGEQAFYEHHELDEGSMIELLENFLSRVADWAQ